MKKYILNDAGEPQACDDVMAWSRWFEATENRVVAKDTVGDVRVSTVFLGLDHNFGHNSDPVLWETMIFGGPDDGYQDRYSSLEEAQFGHMKALAMVRA